MDRVHSLFERVHRGGGNGFEDKKKGKRDIYALCSHWDDSEHLFERRTQLRLPTATNQTTLNPGSFILKASCRSVNHSVEPAPDNLHTSDYKVYWKQWQHIKSS